MRPARTLDGDRTDLGRAVGIDQGDVPGAAAKVVEFGVEVLAEGGDALERRQRRPGLDRAPRQRLEVRGKGHEVGRRLAPEPVELIARRAADQVERDQGPGRVTRRPVRAARTCGRGRRPGRQRANDRRLGAEVAPVPELFPEIEGAVEERGHAGADDRDRAPGRAGGRLFQPVAVLGRNPSRHQVVPGRLDLVAGE